MEMVFKIKVRAEVRPTEDIEKIKNAVKNLLAFKEEEFRIMREEEEDRKYLIAETQRVDVLEPLFYKIRQFRILETFRTQLKRGTTAGIIFFRLNREAAAVNHVSLYSLDSDLFDPIDVTIVCSCPEDFIDWLAPHTKEGKPVKEYTFEYITRLVQE